MSFLDEVDSLKAKLGISVVSPVALVGVAVAALVVLAAVGMALWGSFTAPGVVIEHQESQSENEESRQESEPASLCVHVVGEVANPGMYELSQGARVSDAVEAAGGMLESADQLSVNLARTVSDGEQIAVLSQSASNTSSGDAGQASSASAGASVPPVSSSVGGKVNINTASAAELTSLDGVGDATAAKIIAYRQEKGSFSSIEDIKKVSGIGDKKFEAIKDSITV